MDVLPGGYPLCTKKRFAIKVLYHFLFGQLYLVSCIYLQNKLTKVDIKPSNIILHQHSVRFIDFGTSLDFSDRLEGSRSSGDPGPFSPRYSAPEVHGLQQRSTYSDIFSLGCVYIEILAQLEPKLVSLRPDILQQPYHKDTEKLQNILQEAKESLKDPSLAPVLTCCIQMIDRTKETRIKAVNIVHELASADKAVFFCKDCIVDLDKLNK